VNTSTPNINHSHPNECRYALRRGVHFWALVFEGQETVFKHELGALYVAYLLREQPREPMHGVALALKAREKMGQLGSPAEDLEQREMGLEEAASVRALWRRQRELERVLGDRLEIEPVKAEALRELEEVTEFLRKSPWLSRHGAERCARAVGVAIKRLHAHLAAAVDAEGRPDAVLRAFALHLHEYLLVPSGRGGAYAKAQAVAGFGGCFIYQPPGGVGWEVRGLESKVQGPKSKVQRLESGVLSLKSRVNWRPAAVGYLSRFLCVGCVLAVMATGCAGSRPLKGGRAVITRKPAGVVEQTLVQSENPAQATKQDQESVKVRSYTVPAGSRIEQTQAPGAEASQAARPWQPSTNHSQPSTALVLSAPMPV